MIWDGVILSYFINIIGSDEYEQRKSEVLSFIDGNSSKIEGEEAINHVSSLSANNDSNSGALAAQAIAEVNKKTEGAVQCDGDEV